MHFTWTAQAGIYGGVAGNFYGFECQSVILEWWRHVCPPCQWCHWQEPVGSLKRIFLTFLSIRTLVESVFILCGPCRAECYEKPRQLLTTRFGVGVFHSQIHISFFEYNINLYFVLLLPYSSVYNYTCRIAFFIYGCWSSWESSCKLVSCSSWDSC